MSPASGTLFRSAVREVAMALQGTADVRLDDARATDLFGTLARAAREQGLTRDEIVCALRSALIEGVERA